MLLIFLVLYALFLCIIVESEACPLIFHSNISLYTLKTYGSKHNEDGNCGYIFWAKGKGYPIIPWKNLQLFKL